MISGIDKYVEVEHAPKNDGFVARLVTVEYDCAGAEYLSGETLYEGVDFGMTVSFAIDNARSLGTELRFTPEVVGSREFKQEIGR